ncbi:hypothetical protein AB9H28_23480, partial [Salmonella enterica subsp. enterica serovar Kentucky]
RFLQQCFCLLYTVITWCAVSFASMKYIDHVRWLRQQLTDQNYFWFNAYECDNTLNTVEETIAFCELDPLYLIETHQCPSQLDICTSVRKSIFMNAEGDLFDCHISKIKIGNLYHQRLNSPACQGKQCHCFLAYQQR